MLQFWIQPERVFLTRQHLAGPGGAAGVFGPPIGQVLCPEEAAAGVGEAQAEERLMLPHVVAALGEGLPLLAAEVTANRQKRSTAASLSFSIKVTGLVRRTPDFCTLHCSTLKSIAPIPARIVARVLANRWAIRKAQPDYPLDLGRSLHPVRWRSL